MDGEPKPTFLGLSESDKGPWDVVILPIPFEMTTSWGEGTEHGPAAAIEVSSQVELYDPLLEDELPCGRAVTYRGTACSRTLSGSIRKAAS